MASVFVRGYRSMPPIEEIAKIEGIILVDNDAPAGVGGTASNYACLIGEFSDMRASYKVDQTGQVIADYKPDFALSQADLIEKFGGFDSTLGQFGNAMGNGYMAVAGKVFGAARLICLPVLLVSQYAGRVWRQLPTNASATDPSPFVPMQAGYVPGGYEFKTGNNRLRAGRSWTFDAGAQYSTGTDGATTSAGAATTNNFVSASGDFTGATDPSRLARKGDLLVLGVLGAAGALGANARTFRVVSVTNATTIVVEQMAGTAWDWTTGTAQPWRLHKSTAGDSGGNTRLSEAAGCVVAARPLDATIAAATVVNPTVAPPVASSTVWDPLSGLQFSTNPSQPLTYTAAVQAPNAANSSALDALYTQAIQSLLADGDPQSLIGGVACARKSQTIALSLWQHVQDSLSNGHIRIAFVAPAVNVSTPGQVVAQTYPGVVPLRTKYLNYYWPPVLTTPRPEAVDVTLATADGQTTVDGKLDMPMDEYALALYSRIPPEENPGKASEPVPSTFATIAGYARGISRPTMATYMLLKSRGVSAVKVDGSPPAQIQSAVNTLLPRTAVDPLTFQNVVAMTQFVANSLAEIGKPYSKELATLQQLDSLTGSVETFFTSLGPIGSGVTPQRIVGFSFSRISTPAEEEAGIFKFAVAVKMVPSMDYIVFSVTCGPNVQLAVSVTFPNAA